MCEFCHKHGEGQKWYLRAENYSEDLLSDMRRRKFIEDFTRTPDNVKGRLRKFEQFMRLPPFVRGVVTPMVVNRQKKAHYGFVYVGVGHSDAGDFPESEAGVQQRDQYGPVPATSRSVRAKASQDAGHLPIP